MQSTDRTQSREAVSQAQARIREAVTRNKEKLTALLHHVTVDTLRWAFSNLKKRAAVGVDQVAWGDSDLDRNLTDLAARVHRGAYRALPSRGSAAAIGEAINSVASLAILTALFAMLFKWFPDTAVAGVMCFPEPWSPRFCSTSAKFAIGWYIGTQGLESTYGAAASIVVLLVWVYYAAQIVLFGAELTHAHAAEAGSRRTEAAEAGSPHKANS